MRANDNVCLSSCLHRKHQPKRVLELGTYCASSTVIMGAELPEGAMIYSVDPGVAITERVAKPMVEWAGVADKVTFVPGLSTEVGQKEARE